MSTVLEAPQAAPAPPAPRRALRRVALALAAPLAAAVVAALISSVVLAASGNDPVEVYRTMWESGTQTRSLLITVNNAVPFYLAGVAVAIGFRAALFNIGVEGQYQLAALLAAAAGAKVHLPTVLHIGFILLVAVLVGALWSGVAGALKVTRGVSEVISTIMLNVIAAGLAAYLLAEHLQLKVKGSNNSATPPLPESAHFPTLNWLLRDLGVEIPRGTNLGGFVVVAIVVGIGYWVVISRSRFGFELRATGLNPFAAVASGVDAKKTVFVTMLVSGALAGLVGMPQLLGSTYAYGLDFTAGIGLTGIGVALLGRNSPVGIALAALLFAFLERSSSSLQFIDVPRQIYVIMEGSIVLSVVVAYEAVRRIGIAQDERAVRQATEPAGASA
jgi:ABC-type uncharacterized transport system permease subunit